MSSKPQISTADEVLTDTVVTVNSSDVKSAKPQQTTKAINAYGIQVLKGGNVIGSSFIDSVINAYTNLFSYQPIAVLCMLLSLFYYLSLLNKKADKDPFSIIHNNTLSLSTHADTGALAKCILVPLEKIFLLLKNNKAQSGLFLACIFPYLTKPSSKNAIISSIVFVIAIVAKLPTFEVLLLSQLFFLFVQLRDPVHKTFIAIVAVLTCIVGHEFITNVIAD